MLRSMRSSVGSIFAKIILGLLVLSFVGWGVADYTFGGRAVNVAASVGDIDIPVNDLSTAFRQEVAQQGLDQNNPELLRQLGVAQRALEGLVVRALYSAEAANLNVTAGDVAVRREIESRPEFRNQFQQFDRGIFQQYVRYSGGDEAAFVETIRRDVARDYLIAAVASGAAAPPALVDAVVNFTGERRNVTAISVPTVPASDIEPASESALKAFFDENVEDYRKPEYRTLSYIYLSPEALAAEVELEESMVQQAYEDRQGEFSKQETRHIQQLIVPSAETAEQIQALMAEGKTFAEAAMEAAGVDEATIDLGVLGRRAIPDSTLAEVAFSLPEGGVSPPTDGAFGQFIVHVKSVNSGEVTPLEEVRDQIEADLKLDQAIDLSYELSKQLDDALGDGLTLEEAGRGIGVPALNVSKVDDRGNDPNGVSVGNLPTGRQFLQTAFESPIDETSFLVTGENDSFFVVRVDAITESRLPTLEEVRNAVSDDWIADQRATATEERAAALAERIVTVIDLPALAAEEGLTLINFKNLNRNGRADDNRALPPELTDAIFGLAPGAFTHGTATSGAMVVRLEEIVPASETINDTMKDQIADRIAIGTTTGLIEQLSVALRNRHTVDVNANAIEYVIDPTAYHQAMN